MNTYEDLDHLIGPDPQRRPLTVPTDLRQRNFEPPPRREAAEIGAWLMILFALSYLFFTGLFGGWG
jgi:hypothetical protein